MDHGCWLLVVSCLNFSHWQQTTNNQQLYHQKRILFRKGPLFNLRNFRKSIDKKKRRGYNNIRFAKISQICRHLFFVGRCWLCVVCHYPPSNKQRATNNCQRLLFYFKLFDSIRAFLITVDRQPLTVNRQPTTNNQQSTTRLYLFIVYISMFQKNIQ